MDLVIVLFLVRPDGLEIVLLIIKLLKNILKRIYDSFMNIYTQGVKDLLINKRYIKALVDIFLIFLFIYGFLFFPFTSIMIVICYGLLMSILNRVTYTEDGFVLADMTKPFLTIFLLTWVRHISLFMSFFSIPLLTRQIENRYYEYKDNIHI